VSPGILRPTEGVARSRVTPRTVDRERAGRRPSESLRSGRGANRGAGVCPHRDCLVRWI